MKNDKQEKHNQGKVNIPGVSKYMKNVSTSLSHESPVIGLGDNQCLIL